jgi:hypothetical protein
LQVGGNMDYFNGCGFPLNYAIDYNNVEESSFWTKCNATVSNKLVVGKIPMVTLSTSRVHQHCHPPLSSHPHQPRSRMARGR